MESVVFCFQNALKLAYAYAKHQKAAKYYPGRKGKKPEGEREGMGEGKRERVWTWPSLEYPSIRPFVPDIRMAIVRVVCLD